MANPLADEARTLSDAELAEAINEAYREMFNLQFQRGTRQLQNPMAIKVARRQIARLRTILRERQHAGAAAFAPLAQTAAAQRASQREAAQEPEAAPTETTETTQTDADDAELELAAVGEDADRAPTSEDD